MTRQIGPQRNSIVSTYLVSNTASDGYFTTISEAITAAVADGASYSNQKNIYVKPSSTPYAAFTLADGINIIGGDLSSPFYQSVVNNSVQITGPITLSSGNCKILNVTINANNANAINFSGGTLNLYGVTFNLSGISVAIAMTSASSKTLDALDCSFGGSGSGTSSLFSGDGAAATISISTRNSNDNLAGTSTFAGASGNVTWNTLGDLHQGAYVINCPTFNSRFEHTAFSVASPFHFTTGASTTGTAQFTFCQFNGAPPISCGNSGLVVTFVFCTGTSFAGNSYVSNQSIGNVIGNSGSQLGFLYSAQKTGYRGSEDVTNQAFVQTTDATVTTLASIVLNQLESITLTGNMTAAQSDHTNAIGGTYTITARRQSGGNVTIVGTAVTVVNSSSAATFTCDVDVGTQTVRVRVTGVAATTYNWTTTYHYQKMLNNT